MNKRLIPTPQIMQKMVMTSILICKSYRITWLFSILKEVGAKLEAYVEEFKEYTKHMI